MYCPWDAEGIESGVVLPTTAFDRLNVGTDGVTPCEKLIRVLAAQFSHKVLDCVGGCVERSEGGVSLRRSLLACREKGGRDLPLFDVVPRLRNVGVDVSCISGSLDVAVPLVVVGGDIELSLVSYVPLSLYEVALG